MNCCRISLGFDHQFVYVNNMSQNQNEGNVELNKMEGGDEKKKAKSPMTWHKIECNGSIKKRFEGAGVQSFQVEEKREDMLFWFSTKSRCPRVCRGQPNWLVRRGRWLNVMTCNVSLFWIFFYVFLYVSCILLHYDILNKIVFWLISIKVAYWIVSIKTRVVNKCE